MTALFGTWFRALAATWPTVLAWYLGGVVVRESVLSLAAPIGADSGLSAFLLLPLAVLARLISYVGMFLAVRRALPATRALAGPRQPGAGRRAREFLDVLLASIVPFFVLYGLVGLLQQDVESYANRAARWSFGKGLAFLGPGSGPLVVAVIVLAFLGRQALQRWGDRLPRAFALLEIYLEAVWVFVAVSGISASLGPVLGWIRERQVVRWGVDGRQVLRELWTPLRVAIDGIDGLVPLLLQLIALPLAWLLVAGIVSTRDLAAVAEERVVPKRVEVRLRTVLGRLPAAIAKRRRRVDDEWDSVYRPLTVAARLIARTDPGALAAFLASSALVVAAQSWAVFAATRAIGANDFPFWSIVLPLVTIPITAVAETVRICLLAAAFDLALAAWRARRISAPAVRRPSAPEPRGDGAAAPASSPVLPAR